MWKIRFAVLKQMDLPQAAQPDHDKIVPEAAREQVAHRGRVDLSSGRRRIEVLKTVHGDPRDSSVLQQAEKEQLAGRTEGLQRRRDGKRKGVSDSKGDRRDGVARILSKAGFRPVFAEAGDSDG